MGKGLVDQLKKEFEIEDTWLSFELHPETPEKGIPLSERFKGYDLTSMYDQLRLRGKETGIIFGNHTILSNSRDALIASEYARDMGKHHLYHENMFHAYFTDTLDIGSHDVISGVAKKSGLDEIDTLNAVKDKKYFQRLDDARNEGYRYGLTGVPLFIINNKYKISGAQSADVFRSLLNKIISE